MIVLIRANLCNLLKLIINLRTTFSKAILCGRAIWIQGQPLYLKASSIWYMTVYTIQFYFSLMFSKMIIPFTLQNFSLINSFRCCFPFYMFFLYWIEYSFWPLCFVCFCTEVWLWKEVSNLMIYTLRNLTCF